MDVSKNLVIITIVVLVALVAVYIMSLQGKAPKDIEAFSKCLASKNVTMYGAYWCPHCQNQKLMFGESWKNIRYVECDNGSGAQVAECTKAGISGYPTWDFPGKKMAGELTFEEISQYSGCPLE